MTSLAGAGSGPAPPARPDPQAAATLATALREEWGRLLALLVAQHRRLDLAEEGLADVFEAAARTWPAAGAPVNPPAWLLTTARRRITDRLRSESVAARKLPLLVVDARLHEEAQRVMADAGDPVRDDLLRLVLLCAHPALPRENAAALTLRLVLGVPTGDVARLFLVSDATMAARLTRARKRLAGERFTVPSGRELESRVAVVAEVAYLAFTTGYAPASGADPLRAGVAAEAIRLVRVLREVLPHSYAGRPELDALLALMLLQHSRRDARVAGDRLVLLADQDRGRWHHTEIAEGLELLRPLVHAPAAPYLLQALIAAEHAVAPTAAATDWARIAERYRELEEVTGSPVVRLNRAVAVAEVDGPLAGLALLADLSARELPGHRLPTARAELLARAGRPAEAATAYDEAIGRCTNLAEREHLIERRARM